MPTNIRQQWEGAAPGWAQWEPTITAWMAPATEAMLTMACLAVGGRVLDLACGAGSQAVRAAQMVGPRGLVVASDIAETMLHHVRETARAAGLTNVTTLAGAAEDLDIAPDSFDAVICRLGLMLFVDPAKALMAVRRTLRPGGKLAVAWFSRLPPRIRSWLGPCGSCSVMPARLRPGRGNPESSPSALPVSWSVCWPTAALSASSSARWPYLWGCLPPLERW